MLYLNYLYLVPEPPASSNWSKLCLVHELPVSSSWTTCIKYLNYLYQVPEQPVSSTWTTCVYYLNYLCLVPEWPEGARSKDYHRGLLRELGSSRHVPGSRETGFWPIVCTQTKPSSCFFWRYNDTVFRRRHQVMCLQHKILLFQNCYKNWPLKGTMPWVFWVESCDKISCMWQAIN